MAEPARPAAGTTSSQSEHRYMLADGPRCTPRPSCDRLFTHALRDGRHLHRHPQRKRVLQPPLSVGDLQRRYPGDAEAEGEEPLALTPHPLQFHGEAPPPEDYRVEDS